MKGLKMRIRTFCVSLAVVLGAFGLRAQDASQSAGPTIRAEKKLVLVDVVVTDKKGEYVHGLTAKNFRVWEDKDEQSIETFSAESDAASPLTNRKHYLVLFFDNASMDFGQQGQARKAALQFLDKNAAPNRLIAIVDFGGSVRIAQNFTDDPERLKQVVGGVKFSNVSSSTDAQGGAALSKAETDFGARTSLLGLRSLAKSLSSIPGRKTLVFLSAGFKLDGELRSELTAVIDVCNKANVAVYPIDVRGLMTPFGAVRPPFGEPQGGARLVNVSYLVPQHPTGGGGTGSGASAPHPVGSGSGTGRPAGGAGGGAPRPVTTGINSNSTNQPRSIVPHMADILGPQDVLYALATGTGGFVIVNTNDLLGGLDRIAHEQNEYYVLGYSPSDDGSDGACHELKVKVDRGGTNVRSRTGYCSIPSSNVLAGTAKGKELEARAASSAAGNVSAKMQTAFFYTAANTARVDVTMEVPPDILKFKKEKGEFHSEVNVLGIAYATDGSVAAKFSDTVNLEFEKKKEVEQFNESPLRYETQFDIASGKYNLKVVFTTGGEGFGKLELPLTVEPFDSTNFALSAIALSKDLHKVSDSDTVLDSRLLADKIPLIAQGMQLTPAASNSFQTGGPGAFYLEIYEPALLEEKPHKVALQMRVLDKKTNRVKLDSGLIDMAKYVHNGSPVIPVALRVPSKELGVGSYRVEFKAADDTGRISDVRSTDIEVVQ